MPVKTFATPEEMFEEIERNRRAADARIEDWQRAIQPGDKILRIAPFDHNWLLIYGEVLDVLIEEAACRDLEDPEQASEFAEVQQLYGEDWHQSFRFGRFYSPLCRKGELGDIHLSTVLAVISESEFNACRQAGWPQDLDIARNAVFRRTLS